MTFFDLWVFDLLQKEKFDILMENTGAGQKWVESSADDDEGVEDESTQIIWGMGGLN